MLVRLQVPVNELVVREAPLGQFAGAVKVPTKELLIRIALKGQYAHAVTGSCKGAFDTNCPEGPIWWCGDRFLQTSLLYE